VSEQKVKNYAMFSRKAQLNPLIICPENCKYDDIQCSAQMVHLFAYKVVIVRELKLYEQPK
jgi:hypothetical protein